MEDVQYAQRRTTTTRWAEQDGEAGLTIVSQTWLSRLPLRQARRTEVDGYWTYDVIDDRGHLQTTSTMTYCSLSAEHEAYPIKDRLNDVVFPSLSTNPGMTGENEQRPGNDGWKREQVKLGNRSANCWHCEFLDNNFVVTETIWTELDTHLILRKERRDTDPNTGKSIALEVSDEYIYNREPPEETFGAPPGRPIKSRITSDSMPEAWNALSTKQQEAIQKVINCSDTAWKRADFTEFASVWSFEYLSNLPRQAEWNERVKQQAGRWHRWESVVEAANTQMFVFVPISSNSFSHSERRKVLRVEVKLQVTASDSNSLWEGNSEFYVRRIGRGYKIIQWELPWLEIERARKEGNVPG